ncbi:ras and Rab interactor 2 [Polypterus senegalus]|uniref:ras and Rab interactor 2 n=1 Tax=Polypterus senegalus TaxID=55291 RepID=UPI0019669DB9|nr:ras and Rab interactor 2 [Polypterus senegalus]
MMRGSQELQIQIEKERTSSTSACQENGGSGQQQHPSSPTLLSLLDRLSLVQTAWAPEETEEGLLARDTLKTQPPGSFLVIKDGTTGGRLLCVKVSDGPGAAGLKEIALLHQDTVWHLETSHLGFTDLSQLVGFLTISRDVLPCCLVLPPCLYTLPVDQLTKASTLGTKFWLSPSKLAGQEEERSSRRTSRSDLLPFVSSRQGPSMCSIQVTSENGALCIINPLFLKEHGDAWLTHTAHSSQPYVAGCTPVPYRRDRRLSTTRAQIRVRKHFSLDAENEYTSSITAVNLRETVSMPTTPTLVKLRQKPMTRNTPMWSWSEGVGRSSRDEYEEPEDSTKAETSFVPQSPHRASWIEEGCFSPSLQKTRSETSLCSSDGTLMPPISELDSLSLSSMEDEGELTLSSAGLSCSPVLGHRKRQSLAVADKVKNRISAVGKSIGGLISLERRITNRINELSQKTGSEFGNLAQTFITHMMNGTSQDKSSTEMLQNVRQMLTNLKTYLLEGSELHSILESGGDIPETELDNIVEVALHKVILKPLCSNIYSRLTNFRKGDGSLQKLQDNQVIMQKCSLAELGVASLGLPDAAVMEKIQHRFSEMHSSYSPNKKVKQLLKVCKLIYDAMTANEAKPYGADDFLPVLTYVLIQSNITNLNLDVEYMMELLEPSQLQGEGGYYLTTVFGSLYHISNYKTEMETPKISIEAQNSIHQWKRRRTINNKQSWRRVTQDYLLVSYETPGSLQKTVSIRGSTTIQEVCATCAEKYQVSEPENYALYLFKDGKHYLLDSDGFVKKIKTEQKQQATWENKALFVYCKKGQHSDEEEYPGFQEESTSTCSTASPLLSGCGSTIECPKSASEYQKELDIE